MRHTTKQQNLIVDRGFTLIEMIVYIAVMAILASALVVAMSTIQESFSYMKATQRIADSGSLALERMVRELRFADNVDTTASTFDVSPGVLVLNTEIGGSPTTLTFALNGGRVTVTEGLGPALALTGFDMTVTNLMFTHMTNTQSEGVLVELGLSKIVRDNTINKQFRTFIVLHQ